MAKLIKQKGNRSDRRVGKTKNLELNGQERRWKDMDNIKEIKKAKAKRLKDLNDARVAKREERIKAKKALLNK